MTKEDTVQAAPAGMSAKQAFIAGQHSVGNPGVVSQEKMERDVERSNQLLRAQRVLRVKEELGKKIGELQELVSNRKLEGFEDSELEGLKQAVKDLNRHLEPLGKILAEAPEGPESFYSSNVRNQGPEGLPVLNESDKGKKASGESLNDDAEEEEVEEEDPETGTKRTVKRKKASSARRR